MTFTVRPCVPGEMAVSVWSDSPGGRTVKLPLAYPDPERPRVDVIAQDAGGFLVVVQGVCRRRPEIPPLPVGARALAYVSMPPMVPYVYADLITMVEPG